MINLHPWYSLTEGQILEELGKRLKAIRLNQNLSQKDVGNIIGKGPEEISRIENGKPITMVTFIRILRALNKLESLDKAMNTPEISPMRILKQQEKQKQRATKKRRQ